MATIKDFVATWSSDLASPPVMVTPKTHGRETDLHRSETVEWIENLLAILWIETDLWFIAKRTNRLCLNESEAANR